jgi:hypothetical protein
MKKSIYKLVLILIGVVFIAGCEYDFEYVQPNPVSNYVDPDPDPIDPTLLSFSGKIVPIFTTGNRCTACHGDGGTRPILTASKAYSEISSMGLVNITDPASSKFYTYVKLGTSPHAWKKYSSSQADLVLQWITEGATNN